MNKCEFCLEVLGNKHHSCESARVFNNATEKGAMEVSHLQSNCPDSFCHVDWTFNGTSERTGQVQVMQCSCGNKYVSVIPQNEKGE